MQVPTPRLLRTAALTPVLRTIALTPVLRTVALTMMLAGGIAAAAHAQVNDPAQTPGAPNGKAQRLKPTREKAPPALPGARAEPDAAAPPGRNAPDLPPTEALFDAINRGDLPMAKEAVNRGADINGKNILGLTPLELSVDLGRNQIAFLLLSLRGNAGYTTTSGPARAPTAAAARGSRAERLAVQRAERQERLEAARAERAERTGRAVPAEPAAPTPQAPRLFTGGGGAPIPQAGFLGFDARR